MFLYILKIDKYDCIKIGISKSYNRIKEHIRTYKEIDLKESCIVKAKTESTIRILEKQLLEDYKDNAINNEELKNKDGYSELRESSILDDVLKDIEYKSKRFKNKGIEVKKGISIFNNATNKNTITRCKPSNDSIETKNLKAFNYFIKIKNKLKGCIYQYAIECNKVKWIELKVYDLEFDFETENDIFYNSKEYYRIIRTYCKKLVHNDETDPYNMFKVFLNIEEQNSIEHVMKLQRQLYKYLISEHENKMVS